jgi:hypothetical protein
MKYKAKTKESRAELISFIEKIEPSILIQFDKADMENDNTITLRKIRNEDTVFRFPMKVQKMEVIGCLSPYTPHLLEERLQYWIAGYCSNTFVRIILLNSTKIDIFNFDTKGDPNYVL